MSLTKSFFDKRQAVLEGLISEGYTDIDDFEDMYSIKIIQLYEAGLLNQRTILSTTDLYDYHVNNKGQKYMQEIIDLELILVKPNCANKLADAVTN